MIPAVAIGGFIERLAAMLVDDGFVDLLDIAPFVDLISSGDSL